MHIYTNKTKDVMVPSVTSVISFIKTKPEFESLIKWANSLGYKHQDYFATLNNAANVGTIVHEALSYIVTNRDIPDDLRDRVPFADINKFDTAISNFYTFYRQNLPTTIYSEKSLLSAELGYGGTLDWLSIEDNKLILTDFKTSSDFREYMIIQLSAYAKLIETITDYKIDSARIILVATPTFRKKEISRKELDEYYKKFDLIYQLYKLYNPSMEYTEDTSENSLIIVDS